LRWRYVQVFRWNLSLPRRGVRTPIIACRGLRSEERRHYRIEMAGEKSGSTSMTFPRILAGSMSGLGSGADEFLCPLSIATNPSGPIVETVWDELLFNETETKQARLTYQATSIDQAQAKLLVREHNSEEPTVIPADKWEFIDAQTVRLLSAGTPFKIGTIYQFIYKGCQPAGHRYRLRRHPRHRLVRTLRDRRRRRHAQPADGGRPAGAHPHALARQLAERALPARFPLQRLQRG
jgi:hypothetical protein